MVYNINTIKKGGKHYEADSCGGSSCGRGVS